MEPTTDVQAGGGAGFDPSLQDPANIDPTSVQADGSEANGDGLIGPESLPPELEETRKQLMRDYHAKTQALAEERRQYSEDRGRLQAELESHSQKANVLEQLMTKEWFQKASREEQARLASGGTVMNVTDDQFEAARNGDKEAFRQIVTGLAQQMVNAQVAPVIQNQQAQLADVQFNQELDSAVAQFPEMQDLIDSDNPEFYGYLNQGFDYVTAYQKTVFGRPTLEPPAETADTGEDFASISRAGSVARSGMPQARGQRVLKANNLDEAMDQAFAALQSGLKDDQFVIRKG